MIDSMIPLVSVEKGEEILLPLECREEWIERQNL